MKKNSIAVIGAGFSGLSAAAYIARAGYDVHLFERHAQPGGRARQFTTDNGFVFDMGPSWYWMPEVMENFFNDFGCSTRDYFELLSLNPQFEMVFADGAISVPESFEDLVLLFEKTEKGAGDQLRRFMKAAAYKYEVSMNDFVHKPGNSWLEFAHLKMLGSALKLDLLTDFRSYVKRYFTNEKLRALMEFPVIFLGASPKDIPAMYSLMNYGGVGKGTFYPVGGIYQLVLAMKDVAERQGVTFHFNQNISKIAVEDGKAVSFTANGSIHHFDGIISSADYSHTESLLDEQYRNYEDRYWSKRTFAPSCLIYYLGFDREIPSLLHHTLFFENDLDEHLNDVYVNKEWPTEPLFYACCPSKTDPTVAPANCENLFLLMPLAINLKDEEDKREEYLKLMLARLEQKTNTAGLYNNIIYKRSYCVSDFRSDYNAYGGNAYGLANILSQTAVLKPKMKNKKLKNLFYTGQLTVPGPGVPPSIISGKIAAEQLAKTIKNTKDETTVR